jgi:hypothetical protein
MARGGRIRGITVVAGLTAASLIGTPIVHAQAGPPIAIPMPDKGWIPDVCNSVFGFVCALTQLFR